VSAERQAPRSERAALAQACAALKVFPLPGVVLLPGAPAPFRVFEPRYRALFEAALSGDRLVAVPTIVDPAQAMEERPALRPVAGLCQIVAEQKNQDGTFEVLLHCTARVALLEEITRRTPWREFRAELVEDVFPAVGGAAALRGDVEALAQLCYDLIPLLPPESGVARLTEAVARMKDPAAMADLVAAAAITEPEARYRVLAEPAVARRLKLVEEELASLVLVLRQGRGTRN
jgi:Lon protease-like protein